MRTEELEKESKLYDNDDECFIHVTRPRDGAYTVIESGDPKVILQAVFHLMKELEQTFGLEFKKQIKMLKWANRNVKHETFERN